MNGCDSIDLKLDPDILTTDLTDSICEGESIVFDGQTLTQTDTVSFTTISSIGCDSVVTMYLTVLPINTEMVSDTICEGEIYDFNGAMLTVSGSYTDTVAGTNGCDSIVTLELLVNPTVTHAYDTSICDVETYTFGGQVLDSSGVYVDTLVSATGCDSILTLTLTVHPTYDVTIDEQICDGSIYDFNGRPLSAGGTYDTLLQTMNGCDSMVTLNLTVLDILTTDLTDSICEGESIVFDGQTLTQTDTVSFTTISSIGCDSVVTMYLTVLPINTEMVSDTICEGEIYDFNGAMLTVSGSYTDTVAGTNGCDSIVTLELLVNPTVTHAYDTSICDVETYTFGGQVLDSSGVYVDTLVSATGCDSILTLTLTVHPTYDVTIDEQICDGSIYDFNGRPLSVAGTYDTLLQTMNGCDSMVTLNLTVLDILITDLTDSICEGESIVFDGQTLTQTDTVSFTTISSIGCDSVVTMYLTVLPINTEMVSDTICEGEVYDFNGAMLTVSGSYTDTVAGTNGCDSIVTLELLVNPTVTHAYDTSICDVETYTFGGQVLDSSGVYVDTLVSATGCDSILTLTLTVHPTYDVTIDEQICDGSIYDFNGRPLSAGGTYDTLLQTMNGCDSMVTLNLTVLDILTTDLTDSICEGESIVFDGQTLTQTDTVSFTTISSIGCDSVVTMYLTVLPINTEMVSDTICEGEIYDFNGAMLTVSGSYTDTVAGTNGCDSIVTLELLVNPTVTHAYDTSICDVETYTFGGQVLDSSGVYVDTLVSATGCDSILTLTLTVHPTYDVTIDEQICDGSIYDFNGRPLSAGGTYDTLLQTMNGCDSMVTLNLTVLDILTTDLTDSICEGESIVFDGQTLTQTDTVSFTTISSIGCDSVVTMYLTVLPINTEMVSDTICEGEIYDFNGAMLTVSGSYTDTVAGTNGCDSIVTLELLVNPTVTHAYDTSICDVETYTFGGQVLDSSGVYVDTLVSATGCDSILTLTLTVHPTYDVTIDEQICDGSIYDFNGRPLSVAGTYDTLLQTMNGCDSMVTLNLTVLDILITDLTDSICEGESIVFDGQTLTQTDTVSFTTISSIGCDSVVTMYLTVLPINTEMVSDTICEGEVYDFNGAMLTVSGSYTDTVAGTNGCDSIVTLELLVNPTVTHAYDTSICDVETYTFGGQVLDSSGVYVDTLVSATGCDSILTLTLTVHPTYDVTIDEQICDGSIYDFNGRPLSAGGTYDTLLQTMNGCDSMVTLNLTVLDILTTDLTDSICEGESIVFDGQTLTQTDTVSFTTISSIGCDSVVTMYLTVLPINTEMVSDTICEGEIYDFNGAMLTVSGSYTDTVAGTNGCDSIVTLELLVNPTVTHAYDTSICDVETYTFGGQVLDSSGVYVDTLVSATGCDSILTLTLTVHPTYDVTIDEQICDGSIYDFNGRPLSAGGTYDTLLQTMNGCDSMVTLNLTVLDILTTDLTDSICEGESIVFDGQTLTQTDTVSFTTISSIGCDSVVTMYLTVLPINTEMVSDTICEGEIYDFNGAMLTVSGSYTDTVAGTNGCDSIVTLELLVNPTVTHAYDTSICDVETYTFGGQVLDSSGVYVDTLVSATGCDSILTLTLTVHPTYDVTIDEQICDGSIYDFNGRPLSAGGTYDTLLQTMNGCDSMVTLNLTVLDILITDLTDSICEGESIVFDGQTLTQTDTVSFTTISSIGCDSVVTMYLTVLPINTEMVFDTICEGDLYDFNGNILSSSGTYVETVPGTNGCDSIVTLELLVNPTVTHAYDTSICDVETYTFGSQVLDSSGVYVDTLVSATGCDSILTLTLTVHPTYDVTIDEQICDGSIYDFNGRPLSAGGTYDTLLQTMNGCDSMVTLNLTVLDILTTDLTDSICEGESILFDGQTLTQTDTVSFTTISSIGCDSVVTMYLTVLPINTETVFDTICEGDLYDFNGNILSSSGTYVETVPGTNGCDSMVTLELHVNPTVMHAYDTSICDVETYTFGGQVLDSSGVYVDTLVSATGCDSILTLTLTVHPTYDVTIDEQICDGSIYDFNGRPLSVAGTYDTLLQTMNGCDSMVTLNLTVLDILTTDLTDSICEGESIVFDGQTLTQTDTVSFTTISSIGCDSVVTMYLTVLPINTETVFDTICEGDLYDFNGNILSSSGTYVETVPGTNGCDSMVTLELHVNPTVMHAYDTSICDVETYTFGGQVLDSSGVYVDTLVSATGCDSILTLTLTVHPTYDVTIDEQICDGSIYDFNGRPLSVAGTYDTLLQTMNGCDSMVTLNLTVLDILTTDLTDSICEGESIVFDGQTLTQTDTVSFTTISSIGCDSVVTMYLTVLPINTETVFDTICEGDLYDFNGNILSIGGTYVETVPGTNGCDSIVTLELHMNPIVTYAYDTSICDVETYTFGGQVLDSSGVYVDTLVSATGCDSIVTLTLTVHPTYEVMVDEEICEGTTFDFNGRPLSAAGTYDTLLRTKNGCDSMVTLNLTVLDILTTDLTDSICEGESIVFDGQMLTQTDTVSFTTISSIGCDSVVTMYLTVLPINTETVFDTICEGDLYDFNGNFLSTGGTHVETVPGTNGCDSIVTLELHINPIVRYAYDTSICDVETYAFGGQVLDSTGVYVDTLVSATGCDSIVTLTLTVHPSYEVMVDEQICEGTSFDFNGRLLSQTGIYDTLLQTKNSCDSLVILNLTVIEILTSEISDTICEGETTDFNGQILSEPGSYMHTEMSSIGCDSIITLELVVLSNRTFAYADTICEGDTYTFGEEPITSSGVYMNTVEAANGCDSVVTLDLMVLPVQQIEISAAICQGDTFDFNGVMVYEAGLYSQSLLSGAGCDSVVTLDLVVLPTYDEQLSETICEGNNYMFNGRALDSTGIYSDTLVSKDGCDSILTLDLTILPVLRDTISEEICQGATYDFHGSTISDPGFYQHTLTSSIGCDSIVSLNLVIKDVTSGAIQESICEGDTLLFNGLNLTGSGFYLDTLVNSVGCDSILTLELIVLESVFTEVSASVCEGATVHIADQPYFTGGEYQDTLTTVDGCDSILLINIEIIPTERETIQMSICSDEQFDFHGLILDSAGIYIDTLQTAQGCDSIVTLELTILETKETQFDIQVCIGQSYTFGGELLLESGTYTDTLIASNGCDSVLILSLRSVETIEVDLFDTICENSFTTINSKIYDAPGIFADTLTAKAGCDSVIHIHIYEAPIEYQSLDITICETDTFDFHGQPINLAGTYFDTLSTRFGCDSIIELNLSTIPTVHHDLAATICEGESHQVGDSIFNQPGNYEVTLVASSGCDSVVHLTLDVIPTVRHIDSVELCEEESFTFNGIQYDSTGTYIDTLVSAAGCDSLAILELIIHPLTFSTVIYNLCEGEIATVDGFDYSSDTTFSSIYTGVHGCDSTVTYTISVMPEITISSEDVEICEGEEVQLQAIVTGSDTARITWFPTDGLSCIDCSDPVVSPQSTITYTASTLDCHGEIIETSITVTVVPLPGLTVSEDQELDLGQSTKLSATNEIPTIPISWYNGETGDLICMDCPMITVQPGSPGVYTYRAASVNSLGCGEEDTVTVTVVDPCEVEKIVASNAFTPNGDGFNDYFEIRNDGISNITRVEVYNRWGERVFETSNSNDFWDGTFRGEPVNPGVFMYTIQGVCQNDSDFLLSGNVTVIR